MSKFVITVQGKRKVGHVQWYLDQPCDGQPFNPERVTQQGLQLTGWLVVHPRPIWNRQSQGELLVNVAGQYTPVLLNRARPDVVKRILKHSPTIHPQLNCGFDLTLPLNTDEIKLVYRKSDEELVLCTVRIVNTLKVLKGKNNWLFLDNDTNGSVAQFTGQKLLNADELKQWNHYAAEFSDLAKQKHFQQLMMLIPAKEQVYPQYYPHVAGELSPVDQVVISCRAIFNLIYPQQLLQQSSLRTYLVTDTHWSEYGALLGTKALAQALNLNVLRLEKVFASDQYKVVKKTGDLGGKLFPRQQADEWTLASYHYSKFVLYDNKLPNFGRIIVISDSSAITQGTCLLFGSSSAYSMLNYLARVFKRFVLVHTAGNIDPTLIDLIKPDYVLTQTNARFVTTPPVTNYVLADVMQKKLASLTDDQANTILSDAEKMQGQTRSELVKSLHALLERAATVK